MELKIKKVKRRISVKYHVVAILDYNIILAANVTSRRTADSPTLRSMFKDLPQMQMEDSILNADRAYDADCTCELVYGQLMKPNIKQRETEGANRGPRFRRQAAEEFDEAVYPYRGLVEGIFGAEEAGKGLKTRCRLRRMQRRWRACNGNRP